MTDAAQLTRTPAAVEPAAPRRRGLALARSIGERYAIIAVWAVMIAVYSAAEPGTFFTTNVFQVVFNGQQPLVFMTCALLCTICVGEFVDLSVPSVFAFGGTVTADLFTKQHQNFWAAALIGVLAATAVGAVNGFLIVYVRVNTIVVTLGMGTLLLGVSLWMSNLNSIGGLSRFEPIANTRVLGLNVSFFYGLALVALFAYILWFTPLGRSMRFVGANREVSRLSGIRVDRIRFGSFVAAAAISGVGSVIAAAGLGAVMPGTSQEKLLPVFASVFLGTAVFEPGRFNPAGTFVGIYFLATGLLGLELLGLNSWVEQVFYGGVLVVAVTISTLLRRRTT
jgi:ribose transport system permease protein